MDADKLSFLDDELETTEAEAPEQPEQPEPNAEAPPEAEAPETVEGKGDENTPAAPPAASEEKQPSNVPLAALLDEREKRQRIERELEELRRWRQQQENAAQPKPDFYENPEAVLAQQQQAFQHAITSATLKQSRFLAERDHGADVVAEAYAYFDQHPEQSAALLKEPSPFHAAVEHYKRQKLLTEVGNDPEAWRAQQEAEIRAKLEAELAQRKPAAPPRSLASAPSAGGETHSPGSAFDELFPG